MALWRVDIFPEGFGSVAHLPEADRVLDLANADALAALAFATRQAWADANFGIWPPASLPYPAETPRPRVQLPTANWAPDALSVRDGHMLVSGRLREAMALDAGDVQYLPIELLDGSDIAYAQDYRWMAWNPTRPAIDLSRSQHTWEQPVEGLVYRRLRQVTRVVWRDDANDEPPLFWCAEYPSFLLATELLASRVDRAGCNGLRFERIDGINMPPVKASCYRPRAT